MEINHVAANYGWNWIKQGWALFVRAPILWLVLLLITFIGATLISLIPVIGQFTVTLLTPVIVAGWMSGCRALKDNQELELTHLFNGFRQHTTQLVTVGGLTLLGELLIIGVMAGLGASTLVGILISNTPPDPGVLMEAIGAAGGAILIGITLFLLLLMATQFAPMLVYFQGVAPFQAMKLSLLAFFRNIGAFTVYGLLFLLLAFLASLPLMLGWLVLMPVMVASLYPAYCDLFPQGGVTTETAQS